MFFADRSSGAGRRVLVVEDEFLIAEDIAATLCDLGYEVVGPAPTIDEAVALIGSERLDAALLDANLDGTSSAPIAAALAERHIPFVVVTGYGSLALTAADLDCAPRVAKPFTAHEIAATLDAMLGR